MSRSPRWISRLTLPMLGLVFLLSPVDADAQYRHLCTSIPSACTYTGPNAPTLAADVCFGSAFGIRLKGSGACPSGSWAYFVDYGELVDPITNQVAAYIPLDDACAKPGICVDGPPPASTQEFAMCCDTEYVCTHNVTSCGGTMWFCHDGVCNADGTVECFHAVEGG